jgi:hypothetical protein
MDIHLVLEPDAGQCVIPKAVPSEMLGIEELCRMLYGARQRTGHRGRVKSATAVSLAGPSAHTSSLAMAIVAAGGRFLHVRAGQDAKQQDVPPLFWWSLPGKRRILCHHDSSSQVSLIPPADYPYRHWLCVDTGPAALQLSRQACWIAERFDQPRYCVGCLDDFAEAVLQDHCPKLPVVKGELVDGSVADIARQPGIVVHRRDAERLTSAEILRTMVGQMTGPNATCVDVGMLSCRNALSVIARTRYRQDDPFLGRRCNDLNPPPWPRGLQAWPRVAARRAFFCSTWQAGLAVD